MCVQGMVADCGHTSGAADTARSAQQAEAVAAEEARVNVGKAEAAVLAAGVWVRLVIQRLL